MAVIALLLHAAGDIAGNPSTSTRPAVAEQLQIGDRLRVSVPDLLAPGRTTALTPLIDIDGKIGLLLIKPVAAVGLTTDQLADNIAQAYSDAHLISNADVGVERIEHPTAEAVPRSPLRTNDSLTVRLWDLEGAGIETNLIRQVDDLGMITIPHLKEHVRVVGSSEREAAIAIVKELAKENVLANAQVEVIQTSGRSR